MAKITDLFDGTNKDSAQAFLDYYDGKQKPYLMKKLRKLRKNAITKGLQPRHRNIVKMVVDKSGLLFNGKPPTLNIYVGEDQTQIDENQSAELMVWLDSCDWVEFFTNFDAVVRMLRTGVVLWQYIPPSDGEAPALYPIILGQHNSAVHVDNITRKIDTVVYCTGKTKDGETFRVWTPEVIQDLFVDKHGQESIINAEPNPYGAVPASAFHDTNTPRDGFWNEIPEDLIEINDIYNIALSDSEYSSMWAKYQTAVTNSRVAASDNQAGLMVPVNIPGTPYDRMVETTPAALGGPDTILELDTNGVQAPFFEYKGPKPDLMPLDSIVKQWVIDFAGDWSVNAAVETNASDSGFKLIVREMPNLELRKKRQRMFEAGFHRMFKVIKLVVNTFHPGTFTDDAELFVKFANPDLPIDEKTTEEVWSRRIKEGRASRLMYFMQVHGMTEKEAQATIDEIDAEAAAPAPATPQVTGVTADQNMVTTNVTI